MIKVLFICSGNTCRSPMAEALFNSSLDGGEMEKISASSAGTLAVEGLPAAGNAVAALEGIGISLEGHTSRTVTADMIARADLVVAMSQEHLRQILGLYPGSSSKVILLGGFDSGRDSPDIADPIGGDEQRYEESRDEIRDLVKLLIPYIRERFGIGE